MNQKALTNPLKCFQIEKYFGLPRFIRIGLIVYFDLQNDCLCDEYFMCISFFLLHRLSVFVMSI